MVGLKFGNMKTKQFRSEFDNDVLVNIIGKDDFRYDVVKPIFEQFGFGFMVPTDFVVLIDGETDVMSHQTPDDIAKLIYTLSNVIWKYINIEK